MSEIRNLNPECIWRNFDALTQVPRPSGHLEKVQQFLLDFAAKAGVEAFKDAGGNIVMRKQATPGMENRKGIILQAHMDMVPQKERQATITSRLTPSRPTSTATGFAPRTLRSALTTDSAWLPSWLSWRTRS